VLVVCVGGWLFFFLVWGFWLVGRAGEFLSVGVLDAGLRCRYVCVLGAGLFVGGFGFVVSGVGGVLFFLCGWFGVGAFLYCFGGFFFVLVGWCFLCGLVCGVAVFGWGGGLGSCSP